MDNKGGNREYRGNRGNRDNRDNQGGYRDNRGGNRAYNRDNDSFRPNRGNRPNKNDLDYDRKGGNNRNDYQERKPDRKYEERRGERKPMVKIQEIDPGSEGLRFIAKVLSATLVQGKYNNIRCVLGDETGIVNAFLSENDNLVVGRTVAIFNAEAKVVK